VPNSLVFDNATYFSSLKLTEFSLEKGITLKYLFELKRNGFGKELVVFQGILLRDFTHL
jgi:hypothetical protein